MPSKVNAAGAGQRPASLAQNLMLAEVLVIGLLLKWHF